MKKPRFITITDNRDFAFDYPKNSILPNVGDIVFIEGLSLEVTQKNFHVNRGNLFMITIVASKL